MVLTEFLYEKRLVDVMMPPSRGGADADDWYNVRRVGISQWDYDNHQFVSYLLPCKEINEMIHNHIIHGLAPSWLATLHREHKLWRGRLMYSRLP